MNANILLLLLGYTMYPSPSCHYVQEKEGQIRNLLKLHSCSSHPTTALIVDLLPLPPQGYFHSLLHLLTGNMLYIGMPLKTIWRLQLIQNASVQIIMGVSHNVIQNLSSNSCTYFQQAFDVIKRAINPCMAQEQIT